MDLLIPSPTLIAFEKIEESPVNSIIIYARTTQIEAKCPECQYSANRIHSRYMRQPRDLPISGKNVQIQLQARKFFCKNPECTVKIFCERLPKCVEKYAHCTARLNKALITIVLAIGGELGARLASKLGYRISGATLIGRIRRNIPDNQPIEAVRVLGVDDFAFRKGQNYGTILVDQEKQKVIDLLPDREAKTLSDWLKKHPGIEIITRDRSATYAEGATNGASQAIQIADRWHILKNLSESVERMLTRRSESLQKAVELMNHHEDSKKIITGIDGISMLSSRSQQQIDENRKKRIIRYQEVHSLSQQGETILGIATQLKMSRITIRKYLSSSTYPERATMILRGSRLNDFIPFIHKRWVEGCNNARQLWREVTEQGYKGKEAMVRRYIKRLRKLTMNHNLSGASEKKEIKSVFSRPSARRVTWWLLDKNLLLTDDEQRFIKILCEIDSEVEQSRKLSCSFWNIVKEKRVKAFDTWIDQVEQSSLKELKGFVMGLRKDQTAVVAALKYHWSNGQTEGQVNRLKFIKRQMFGRAKFDLLKARVLNKV